MQEPNAVNNAQQTGGTPPPESFTQMSNEDMIKSAQARLPAQVPLGGEARENEVKLAEELYAERFGRWLDKEKETLANEFPDSTAQQREQFVQAAVTMNIAELAQVFKNITQLTEEKEEKQETNESLNVSGQSTANPNSEPTTREGREQGFLSELAKGLGLSQG